uniref:glutathione transferase n=1 Tax=Glycine max TaxID=3847 RepID=C6SWZ2_SOYBN|nr:unknown [Glycine max]
MGSEDVKLLNFWVSPFGKRVEWALKLKGVEYEYIEEDIFNKSNLLLELNPVHKKVPVLVHAQKPIAESFIILEYIDETWKKYPLLPHNPYQRALARFWATCVEQKLGKAGWVAMSTSGDEQEEAMKEAKEMMEKIEEEIKGKNFFGGDNIGYLDIAIGMDCLLGSCLGGSWINADNRPIEISSHLCMDDQFSQPPCDQRQLAPKR